MTKIADPAARPGGGFDLSAFVALAACVLWAVYMFGLFQNTSGDDLASIYFAARFYASGEFDLIYAFDPENFLFVGSQQWDAAAAAAGFPETGILHPFVQPPLVAAVFSPLAGAMDFPAFNQLFRVVNLAAVCALIFVAYRFWRPSMSPAAYVIMSLALVTFSLPFRFSFELNQIQPLILLLMLLALERDQNGAPATAGLALAAAAALKVSPAALALYWVLTGRWRTLFWFAGWAMLFVAANMAVADLSLVESFVDRIRELGAQIVLGRANVGAPAFLYVLASGAPMDFSPHPRPGWIGAATAAGFAAVAVFGWFRSRTADETWKHRALAPAILITSLIVNPLSWVHYFLIVVVFAPTLVDLWGRARGLPVAALVLTLTSAPMYFILTQGPDGPHMTDFLTLAGAALATAAALAAPRTSTNTARGDRDLPLAASEL